MRGPDLVDRDLAWADLAQIEAGPRSSRPVDPGDLPEPARRFLHNAVPSGEVGVTSIVLDMEGEIKLKGWMPFRARQILHPDLGFVWNATVGRPPLQFKGGDCYWRRRGSLEFRLWGLIPVVRAAGSDIDRSAAGRLAAETAVWAPQALQPGAGVTWTAIDEHRATVTRTVGNEPITVTLAIDPGGQIDEVVMQRWGDPDSSEFGLHPFGASITDTGRFAGVTIATAGTVGWHFGTDRQSDGEFFRFRITDAQPACRPVSSVGT